MKKKTRELFTSNSPKKPVGTPIESEDPRFNRIQKKIFEVDSGEEALEVIYAFARGPMPSNGLVTRFSESIFLELAAKVTDQDIIAFRNFTGNPLIGFRDGEFVSQAAMSQASADEQLELRRNYVNQLAYIAKRRVGKARRKLGL